jgi:hypothetical protein
MHSGSCLCGAVKYRINTHIQSAIHCHCPMCRKAHGGAFGTYGNVRRRDFHFTQGEDSLGAYQSSLGVTRTFCKNCGSTLQWFSQHPYPDWLSVALGTLDTPLGNIAQKHIFTESKADWYAITDGLPQERRS